MELQHLQYLKRDIEKQAAGPVSVDIHGQTYERMTAPKWKQTLKDFPAIVLGTGLGYGIGKTVAELTLEKAIAEGDPRVQKLIQHMPAILGVTGGAVAFGNSLLQQKLKERREQAQRAYEESERKKDMASAEKAKMAAFYDELEKRSFVTALGKGLVGLGARGAKAVGQGHRYGNMLRAGISDESGKVVKGGMQALHRNVGIGATALGAGVLGGKMLSDRRQGY